MCVKEDPPLRFMVVPFVSIGLRVNDFGLIPPDDMVLFNNIYRDNLFVC